MDRILSFLYRYNYILFNKLIKFYNCNSKLFGYLIMKKFFEIIMGILKLCLGEKGSGVSKIEIGKLILYGC